MNIFSLFKPKTKKTGVKIASIPGQVVLMSGKNVIRVTPRLARELAACLGQFAAKAEGGAQ